jgi:hypothetical protein
MVENEYIKINHQKYCSPICAKHYSRKNNYKLKDKKSNQPSVL